MVKAWPSNVGGAGLIPGWGPKVPCASGAEKPKYKKYCDKFNKEFKNGPPQKKKKKKATVVAQKNPPANAGSLLQEDPTRYRANKPVCLCY